MHWRGDRAAGFFGVDPCNLPVTAGAACSEDLSFRNFILAFQNLVGKQGTITASEMQQFADFALEIMLPPNPVRALNNTPSNSAASGLSLYNGAVTDGATNCNGCHTLDPARGLFGTNGGQTFERETMSRRQLQELRSRVRRPSLPPRERRPVHPRLCEASRQPLGGRGGE